MRARDRLTDLSFAVAWSVVKGLPEPVARAAFGAGAELSRRGRGARQLRANLRRVVGPELPSEQLSELVHRGLHSYARYWRETFRLPVLDPGEVVARTEVNDWSPVDAAMADGRGVILALPHSGNWDAAGIALVDHLGDSFTTVVERLRPEAVFDRFVGYRQALGMEVLPLTGGDRAVAGILAERLRAGRVLCLLADRDLGAAGMAVDFFGEPAGFPSGPMLLAATTGAALVPVNCSYTPVGWRLHLDPELAIPAAGRLRARVQAGAQLLADAFARGIAAHPQDWHMLQPLWRADLAPDPAG